MVVLHPFTFYVVILLTNQDLIDQWFTARMKLHLLPLRAKKSEFKLTFSEQAPVAQQDRATAF
jgi:hypothetical protein